MKRLDRIFRRPAFQLFLFGVFSTLLGWPLLTIDDQGRGALLFWYLMVVWCLAILLLALIARSLKEPGEREPISDRQGERPGDG